MKKLHLGDKPVSQSLTMGCAVVFALIYVAEVTGHAPPGTASHAFAVAGKVVAGLGTVFGARRAIASNGLGALDFSDDGTEVAVRGHD